MKKKKLMEPCEIFLLRVCCQLVKDPEAAKELNSKEISDTIDNFFPNALEFSKVIRHFHDEE